MVSRILVSRLFLIQGSFKKNYGKGVQRLLDWHVGNARHSIPEGLSVE